MLSPRPDVNSPAGEVVRSLIEADRHVLGDRGGHLVHTLLHLLTGESSQSARLGTGGLGHDGGDGLHLALEAPRVARLDLERRPDLSGRSSHTGCLGRVADHHVSVGRLDDGAEDHDDDESERNNGRRLAGVHYQFSKIEIVPRHSYAEGKEGLYYRISFPWQSVVSVLKEQQHTIHQNQNFVNPPMRVII